ncbi:MAG TPA: hypothetical protein VFX21_16015, partial [Acidimicrobiia bacterium]|nr:hypothetical protein [Acidimicrobiia bacterium]
MRRMCTFGWVAIAGWFVVAATAAHAQVPVEIRALDACLFVDHNDSGNYANADGTPLTTPSVFGLDLSFDNFPPFGPADRYVVQVTVDGPEGTLSGTGPLAPDGRARVPIGISSFGAYSPVGAVVTDQNNAAYTIDLGPVWVDPFVVDANEVNCDFDALTTGAPADVTDTPTSAPTTTAAVVTDDTGASSTGATTTTTEKDDGPPWIPIIIAGAVISTTGLFLLTRNRGKTEDPESAIDGILQGFEGTSVDQPPAMTADDCWEAWQRAVAIYADDRAALLEKYAAMLDGFTGQFGTAMGGLDTFRENYGALLSASSEMQAAVQRWTEVQSVSKKTDLVVTGVTLTVGAGSLAIKGGKWVATKFATTGAELTAEAIAAQRTAAGVAVGAQKLEQAVNAATNINKALAAAPMTNTMQPSAVVITQLAKEAGRDLAAVIAESGGIEAATEKLFWEVFAKRGYHFLPNAGAMAAKFEKPTYMFGKLINSIPKELIAEGFGDAGQVLPRLVANLRITLGKMAGGGAAAAE